MALEILEKSKEVQIPIPAVLKNNFAARLKIGRRN
jgi:hypothetical protein